MGGGFHGGFGDTTGARNNHLSEAGSGAKNGVSSSPIDGNAEAMKADYPHTDAGYFGQKGKNSRVIASSDPIATSKDFYQRISQGGIERPLANGHGTMTVFPDGTRIVYRVITSTKGSPAVDITVVGPSAISSQKIHFILGGN